MSGSPTLRVCTHHRLGGTGSCGAGGGEKLRDTLRRIVASRGLDWVVEETGCLGQCRHGPNLKAAPGGPILHGCSAPQAEALVDRLLVEWVAPHAGSGQDTNP